MPTITLTIPDAVKSELNRFPWVNWSEVGREEVIKHKEKLELFEELEELTKNSKLTDKDCLELGKMLKKGIWKRLKKEAL